ncbi:MAG: hypothetical protein ACWGNI_08940 [Desulfobacterales bacterium]
MDLLKDIKQKRAKQKQKKPFRRNAFHQICCIVNQYGLTNDFLNIIDNVNAYVSRESLNFPRIRVKAQVENHLFPLATKDEYMLTMSIISKIDNPYLKFVHSPEEIIWSKPLYRLNPSIDSQKLIRYHFETLYLHEHAKAYGNEVPHQK